MFELVPKNRKRSTQSLGRPFLYSHHFLSFANRAVTALAQFTAETFLYQVVQAVAQGFEADAVDDLAHEGSHEELASFTEADATLLHIEEGILVELAHGSSVATLYIIGIDLELGLGIHACLACETEVTVGLL